MKSDINTLLEKDVVKIWIAFISVCYFNMANTVLIGGVAYILRQKMHETIGQDPLKVYNVTKEDITEDEEVDTENKKCV